MCVCVCVRARVHGWPDSHCPVQPGEAARGTLTKTLIFLLSFPEQDQMSSRSDTSLTFQWVFFSNLFACNILF